MADCSRTEKPCRSSADSTADLPPVERPTAPKTTTLGRRAPGDRVNLEVDVIAKYTERLLAHPVDSVREDSHDH